MKQKAEKQGAAQDFEAASGTFENHERNKKQRSKEQPKILRHCFASGDFEKHEMKNKSREARSNPGFEVQAHLLLLPLPSPPLSLHAARDPLTPDEPRGRPGPVKGFLDRPGK